MVLEKILAKVFHNTNPTKNKLTRFAGWIITLIILCITWVFFKANTFSDAIYILTNLFTFSSIKNIKLGGIGGIEGVILVLLFAAIMFISEYLFSKGLFEKQKWKKNTILRWAIYIILFELILFFGVSGSQFVYFSF